MPPKGARPGEGGGGSGPVRGGKGWGQQPSLSEPDRCRHGRGPINEVSIALKPMAALVQLPYAAKVPAAAAAGGL